MSARTALTVRRPDVLNPIIGSGPVSRSRAGELVASGALDRAADIADIAHDLADAVIREMEAECSARAAGAAGAVTDLRSLRSAAFKAVVYKTIDRLEARRR
jgi:hypothetical protein